LSKIPVVPKFSWQFELFCVGETYKQEKIEITHEDAKKIFNVLKQYAPVMMPKKKESNTPLKNKKTVLKGRSKKTKDD